jgi:hypothetical protein
MAVEKKIQAWRGTTAISARSIRTGSRCRVSPRRRATRVMWVSTTIPEAIPQPAPSTTLAVFRPTPGSAVSAAMVHGTSPPWRSTRARAHPWRARALARKNPVERMTAWICGRGAAARAAASGHRRNSAGVTRLTRVSVDWAERMVAIRS